MNYFFWLSFVFLLVSLILLRKEFFKTKVSSKKKETLEKKVKHEKATPNFISQNSVFKKKEEDFITSIKSEEPVDTEFSNENLDSKNTIVNHGHILEEITPNKKESVSEEDVLIQKEKKTLDNTQNDNNFNIFADKETEEIIEETLFEFRNDEFPILNTTELENDESEFYQIFSKNSTDNEIRNDMDIISEKMKKLDDSKSSDTSDSNLDKEQLFLDIINNSNK